MDGKTILDKLYWVLQESSSSSFLTEKIGYDAMYEAVRDFTRRTQATTSSQTITTVASTE
jgi:hypothetical protein